MTHRMEAFLKAASLTWLLVGGITFIIYAACHHWQVGFIILVSPFVVGLAVAVIVGIINLWREALS